MKMTTMMVMMKMMILLDVVKIGSVYVYYVSLLLEVIE